MKKVALLVSQSGDGKTTLFNKITNSNQEVQAGGRVVTREVYVKDSKYGQGFTLIDTPGLKDEDCIGTSSKILNLIENIWISRIMVVVRYARFDIIKDTCKWLLLAFERYQDRITIVITHFDFSDDKEREQRQLTEYYHKAGIKSIIFASREDSGETLCELFDSEIKDQPQKMQLTESELLSFQQCDYNQFLYFELLEILGDIYIQSKRLFQGFPVIDEQAKVLLVKEIIKKLINYSYVKFNRSFGRNENDEEQFLFFLEFRRSIIDIVNRDIQILKWNNIVKYVQIIELKNFIQNEMETYDKNFEVGRKKCLQKIRENAKNQKINYL
ncbi:unnamed protein product [Paramecium octaurelia]|uniref:G domain-containing protein n=1 Tax=Paramecium octaurelia TaxID=43137 RepID=A0A8S1W6L8_PAROT|nr:unnamed protein product [Paramecium octaurelia]